MSLPRRLLHLEGAVLLAAALGLYFHGDFGWVALLVLFLAPDLSFAGYLAGPRVGALAYDLAHTSALPVALGAAAVVGSSDRALQLALIWLAHIGLDRMVGYGLKYPSGFGDTHLQRL